MKGKFQLWLEDTPHIEASRAAPVAAKNLSPYLFSVFNKKDLGMPNMRLQSRIKQRSTQKLEVLLFLKKNSF